MTTENAFFSLQKTCPVCGRSFSVTRTRSSSIRAKERQADFRVIFEGVNPLYYQVYVCPACNYAALDNSFDNLTGNMVTIRRSLLDAQQQEPDFQGCRTAEVALRSFQLALRTAQICGYSQSVQGALSLRAAWIARELGDHDTDRMYTEQALHYYEQAFENDRSTKSNTVTITYLIGELHRQVGHYNDAIRWFSRAVTNPSVKQEPEIERLARQQWELTRQQAKAGTEDEALAPLSASSILPVVAQVQDPTNEKTVHPAPNVVKTKKHSGPKIRFTVTLYEDEVDWLKKVSTVPYKEAKEFMDKETVLRALLDAALEVFPDVQGFTNEDELREQFIQRMKDGKKPGN
ncbi:DUF2225 domain-containing protein [Heliobacterium chlorum]|uniref:DUF2225 domain-containing protein n=1 Tax=Heliobacterium chlorum TaxID=2698 RepID=A0ABR7T7I9_HELCL|nr:DUF2225 domain-containing protein [Heliobacterium chlorum]MBC9785978.1 DUF2225 domain-containing protein [Heliobacterium chlorum]